MKKNRIISRMLLLAMAASLFGLFGCGEKNDDTKTNAMSLALLASGSADGITVISPHNGSTDVHGWNAIIIQFPVNLASDKGTVTLTYDTGTVTFNHGNSVIDILDNIVTIYNHDYLSVTTKYWNIVISGFKDQHGNTIPDYINPSYHFTTTTCFVAGTLVSTTDGMKAIETIAAGDMVYAYDFESGAIVEAAVDKVFNAMASQIYRIGAGSELIGVTALHPFYVKGRGWVKAEDLSVGDALVTRNGATVVINSITVENVTVPVYNIEVDGAHNYFVTAEEILVHNK